MQLLSQSVGNIKVTKNIQYDKTSGYLEGFLFRVMLGLDDYSADGPRDARAAQMREQEHSKRLRQLWLK